MRELLQDIEFSKNGKLYEITTKLLKKDKELKIKESEINNMLEETEDVALQTKFRVEFNSQSYYSFYSTKLEKDKSILTLSVAGLGFLVTFINFTSIFKPYEFIFFLIAAVCFMVCILNVVKIFDKNAEYIVLLTTDAGGIEEKEAELKKLDKWAIKSFYLGIVMAFALGACTAMSNSNKEVGNVGKQKVEQLATTAK